MIDPTALLAELAAIQRDVRTLHNSATQMMQIAERNDAPSMAAWAPVMVEQAKSTCSRLAALMSSIAAPPPVDADPAEATERAKHWPACGRRKRTDARCVCDRDHDTYHTSGYVEPVRPPAPPAVPITSPGTYAAADNGMLAPIKKRLEVLERRLSDHDMRLCDHDGRIDKTKRKADGHG